MPQTTSLPLSADSIVDTVREPMLVLSADLRVKKANRSFCRKFRVTPAETVDQLVYELGNGQWDIPGLRKLLEEVLPRDATFDDYEVEHTFPDIGRKYMLLNARRIYRQDNDSEFILLAIEDMTDHRLAEEARQQLESRYTSLVRNIKDHSIFMMDCEGVVTTWNTEAQTIIGYTEEEIIGKNFSIIFTPEDLEAQMPAHELKLARDDGRAEDERWHLRKNGERFWALGIVTPMHDVRGKLIGFSKILRDMTDRKRAEEALQNADRHKDTFLATLAHELRNPLAPIRNGLQLLRLTSDAELQEQTREMMERQLGLVVRLVEDLLDISRISQNKLEMRKDTVELWAIIQSAVETARPQIEANGHTLTVTLPPTPVYLYADLTRLSQVFWNILNNSAKYTKPGGRIVLTATVVEDQAVVTIEDTGIGIPEESLSGLFGMFSQVEVNMERAKGGLGIGLAIVKGLTESHGGTVEVSSAGIGQGSAFIVRLPIEQHSTAQEKKPAQENTRSGTQRRILVVDDNQDGAASLAMLLTIMGHDVRTAHNGMEGVDLAEAFRPDLIVMDVGLPKLNGLDACRRIREMAWAKNTVIVAATGWGLEEDRRRSEEAGCDHHLVKPVDIAELSTLLATGRRFVH